MHPSGGPETRQAEKRQRNQRGEGARLRDELIEAAMRILDRSPDARLSLRMVAKEAGVAAPSVYRHFPDAGAMMTAIVRECWSQMGERLVAAANDAGPLAPFDALKTRMRAFVRYAMERPSRYQLLFAPALGPELDFDGPLRPAFRAVRETIEAIAAGGGHLPARTAFSATLLVISLTHGRIALAHLAPRRPGNVTPEVEAFVADTLDELFLR